jgi:hypothetical protein
MSAIVWDEVKSDKDNLTGKTYENTKRGQHVDIECRGNGWTVLIGNVYRFKIRFETRDEAKEWCEKTDLWIERYRSIYS